MAHPFKDKAKNGKQLAKKRGYAEGGKVGPWPVSDSDNDPDRAELNSHIYDARSRSEFEEIRSGERFHDNGTRIPGKQKAANDRYMEPFRKRQAASDAAQEAYRKRRDGPLGYGGGNK